MRVVTERDFVAFFQPRLPLDPDPDRLFERAENVFRYFGHPRRGYSAEIASLLADALAASHEPGQKAKFEIVLRNLERHIRTFFIGDVFPGYSVSEDDLFNAATERLALISLSPQDVKISMDPNIVFFHRVRSRNIVPPIPTGVAWSIKPPT